MKRYLTIAALVVMLACLALLSIRIHEGVKVRRAIAARISTLPDFKLRTLEGKHFVKDHLPSEHPVIFIYFTTICPYCESELKSIRQHNELKDIASIIMISRESFDVLQEYQKIERLYEENNITIRWDSLGIVHRQFDVSIVPSTFIYGADGQLIKKFTGETSADIIYQALQESISERIFGGSP